MNKKILIAGCGGIGERHTRVMSGLEGIEVSICDVNRQLLEIVRKKYKVANAYSQWNQIDLELFDAVVICTPAHLHIPMVIDSLRANCHVLCEKPLSLSFEGIDDVIALQKEKERIVGVAYIYRSMPGLKLMRDMIHANEIGEIKSVALINGANFPYYRPDYRSIYYSNPEKGGGALHDAVSHMINYIEWCMGTIESIYCVARHTVLPDVEVEDTVGCTFKFTESDAIGSLSLNQFQYCDTSIFEFAGTKGVLRFDEATRSIGICKELGGDFSWTKPMQLSRDEYHRLQAENFINAIDGNGSLVCSFQDAIRTMVTILSAHKSVKEETPIQCKDLVPHSQNQSIK
jgi:predicted dehydrogenase